jgi:hypothetical protein
MITPPERFDFSKAEEWSKWIRRFERFRIAAGLAPTDDESHVNTLIYCIGDKADDIMTTFDLTEQKRKKYTVVRHKFETHFVTSAPEHFQKRMSAILSGVNGVVNMVDDTLVYSKNQHEHDERL